MMSAYVPHAADLAAVLIAWALVPTLVLAGRVVGGAQPVEMRLVAGWGLLCLVLTFWGALLPARLFMPALGFVSLAWASLAVPAWRPTRAEWLELARLLVLSLPFWLILAPLRPSQPDTFLNLLPNATYLADFALFPTLGGPDSHSFLPVAPYNTQLVAFLGSLVMPVFASHGMSFFNLILQLAAGLLFARILDQGRAAGPLSWGAVAAGLLLAIPLNPGFVPRLFLAPYGEPGLAVTALFAALVLLRPAASGWMAGLVLAALINIKQSGVGLVAALALAFIVLSVIDRRRQSLAASARFLAQALVAPVALYLLWRWYVLAYFPTGELKPLAWNAWQWGLTPEILGSMGRIMANKGVFYGLVLMSLPLLLWKVRRQGWTLGARALLFHAVLFGAYDLFLIFTYIGHFKGDQGADAHSYFRYSQHLSLVMVLAYVLALGECVGLRRVIGTRASGLAMASVALILLLPLGFAKRLRFDLDQPQPALWAMAQTMAKGLAPRERLALLLPGDDGSVDAYVQGVLRATAPHLTGLETVTLSRADEATLAAVAASGYHVALVSCTDPLLAAAPGVRNEGPLPTGFSGDTVSPRGVIAPAQADEPSALDRATLKPAQAVLLRWHGGVWRAVAHWDWPAARGRWQFILAAPPLCRAPAS